jgi:GNAT superfamily N-acetyltransferase
VTGRVTAAGGPGDTAGMTRESAPDAGTGPEAASAPGPRLEFVQWVRGGDADPYRRAELIACWTEVTNTGGAAGFPFPPVTEAQVGTAVDALLTALDPRRSRILMASLDGRLAGWVHLGRELDPLIAHWGTVRHLQTRPGDRRRGIGSALMTRLRHLARTELELRQLRLAVRGGMGLEPFYERLGWRQAGRWPEALRLAPDDLRDEILMVLAPL